MTEDAQIQKDETLKKLLEKEEKTGRKLTGVWHYIIAVMSVFMVCFYFYSAGIKPVAVQYNRGLYVLLTYVMVFLVYPFSKRSPTGRPSVFDIILALLSIFATGYWIKEFEALNYRIGSETKLDIYISILGLLLSLEVSRRVLGWAMTIMGFLAAAYCYFGPWMPGPFAHRQFSIERTAVHLFLTQDGVFGVMANVLVTYVILFIFFGAFLKKSGAGQFFLDFPMSIAGKTTGGPAKVACMASTFFGSISGSAIANTVSTGTFTIPLMKKAGFRPHVAGAIEPSASIVGMFMPPIMGAGGFLMAELTRTPYVEIMKMAVGPALLYFLSVFVMVHFEAKKHGIVGLKEDLPNWKEILRKEWYMSLPLIVIVVLMLLGFSPGLSAFWASITCIVISWFRPDTRMGIREIYEAMLEGARNTLVIGATVGVIGMIVGSIALTGVGLKFSDIIISLSQGNLTVAILLIGLASLVLGMGVPVTAAYLITAVLAVPALDKMGVNPIAAHMIVYWFSQDSNITPPVCVAAYAGAAIAGSDPWKTGWTCFKFAKFLYIGPFLFAYVPGILLQGSWHEIVMAYLSATIGTIAFGALTMGYLIRKTTIIEWIFFAVGTFLCYHPHLITDLTGIGLIGLVYLSQKYRERKERLASQAVKP
ncbi:TRAP transporter permease [Thermodesulforhabdus norvegica]|uniref:TRAP transporter, 4TM/12TM fusion protein n=1 Tax=Thermodesulforhabdus norvegica TaxID=39841 RepID=A0A1I4TXV0_9BACT|nr:TRAP transporter permease [Thermodesulforhabdus norvegica]SFM81391.1 TRAP transporter, 4TM/12TM fusion protein [Thermodesulforhabdus norvegica]